MIGAFICRERPRPVGIDRQCAVFGIDRLTGGGRLGLAALIGIRERCDLTAVGTQIVVGEQVMTAVTGTDGATAFFHLEGRLTNRFRLIVDNIDVDLGGRARTVTIGHRKIERQVRKNVGAHIRVIQITLKLERITVFAVFFRQ